MFRITITESQQGRPEPVLSLARASLGRKVSSALLVEDHHDRNLLTIDGDVDDVAQPGQPDVLLTELDTEGGGGQLTVLVHHGDNVIGACGDGGGGESAGDLLTCQEVVVRPTGRVTESQEESWQAVLGCHCESELT